MFKDFLGGEEREWMSLEFAKINMITFLCHETFYPKFIVFYLEHTFNFFYCFLIGGKLLHNAELVSTA